MELNHEQPPQKISDSLDLYSRMVGLNQRRLPKIDEMPGGIFLPEDIIRPLWKASQITNEKDREVSFSLSVKDGQISRSGFTHGSEDSVIYITNFFKTRLAEIHSHPNCNTNGFSNVDLADFYANPHNGYLYIVISNGGVAMLARTLETSRLPISSTFKEMGEKKYLDNKKWLNTNLTKRGYVYYEWENRSRTFVRTGKDGSGHYLTNHLETNPIGGLWVDKTNIRIYR